MIITMIPSCLLKANYAFGTGVIDETDGCKKLWKGKHQLSRSGSTLIIIVKGANGVKETTYTTRNVWKYLQVLSSVRE
jgi:hypothetical protein